MAHVTAPVRTADRDEGGSGGTDVDRASTGGTDVDRALGPSPSTARAHRRTAASAAATFLLLLGVFLASPVVSRSDPALVPYTARAILHDGDADLRGYGLRSDYYGLIEDQGRVVSYFPVMSAVFAVPFVAAQDLLSTTGLVPSVLDDARAHHGQVDPVQRVGAGAIGAAAVVVLALVARRLLRLTGDRGAAARADRWWFLPVTSVALALGTSVWSTASRGLWQHGPGLLLVGAAWLAALHLAGRDHRPGRLDLAVAVASGAAAGLAVWVRPTNAVFGVAVLVFVVATGRRWSTWALGAAGALVAGGLLDLAVLGTAVPPYFRSGRFELHDQFAQAVGANLVSPARGLLVFSPVLLLSLLALGPVRRRLLGAEVSMFAVLALGATLLVALAASGYAERWWAGYSFGPRFLTETVAVLGPVVALVVFGPRPPGAWSRAVGTVLAPALLAVSVLVHAGGALTPASECWNGSPVAVDDRPSRVWDWSDAQALLGLRLLASGQVGADVRSCEAGRTHA